VFGALERYGKTSLPFMNPRLLASLTSMCSACIKGPYPFKQGQSCCLGSHCMEAKNTSDSPGWNVVNGRSDIQAMAWNVVNNGEALDYMNRRMLKVQGLLQ
jgi:hypothetical protein